MLLYRYYFVYKLLLNRASFIYSKLLDVKKMKNAPQNQNLDLVFVIDKNGSMYVSQEDAMADSFIERERKKEFETNVTTVLFNDGYEMLYKRKPIHEVDNQTSKEYYVGGCADILDAIGKTVVTLDKEIGNKVLFVIMTDGLEDSYAEYSKSHIKNMIENHNWDFIFIGADIDSYDEVASIGIRKSRVANYKKSSEGIGDAYLSMEEAFQTGVNSYTYTHNKSLDFDIDRPYLTINGSGFMIDNKFTVVKASEFEQYIEDNNCFKCPQRCELCNSICSNKLGIEIVEVER